MRIANSLTRPMVLPVLIFLALVGFADRSHAMGTSIGKPWLFSDGIACDASLLPWRSVWFGHFSGGLAYYPRGDAEVKLVWHDQKLCFPSRRECMAWQRAQHRLFHRVEGHWTCLRLR